MAAKAAAIIEVEIDDPRNRSLNFPPLQRKVRGRFDLNRCAEPLARLRARDWPEPVPGMRIGLNLDEAEGYLADPLHDPQHAATRERITGLGMRLGAERETFDNIDVATWAFWLGRAVEAGAARIVAGELPAELPGEPQREFITRRQPSDTERLAAAVEKQTAAIEKLLSRLVAK